MVASLSGMFGSGQESLVVNGSVIILMGGGVGGMGRWGSSP